MVQRQAQVVVHQGRVGRGLSHAAEQAVVVGPDAGSSDRDRGQNQDQDSQRRKRRATPLQALRPHDRLNTVSREHRRTGRREIGEPVGHQHVAEVAEGEHGRPRNDGPEQPEHGRAAGTSQPPSGEQNDREHENADHGARVEDRFERPVGVMRVEARGKNQQGQITAGDEQGRREPGRRFERVQRLALAGQDDRAADQVQPQDREERRRRDQRSTHATLAVRTQPAGGKDDRR